jgi:hypothetical protein
MKREPAEKLVIQILEGGTKIKYSWNDLVAICQLLLSYRYERDLALKKGVKYNICTACGKKKH